MTTPNNLRRFELEAEALARLEHPAIARIYEAGTAETSWGRIPYFAMERVQGRPIFAHCAERSLGLRARVAMLAKVCDAIEHAHGKGVVHRDLKSSNVLVGDDGDPKVLDFGVARLAERGDRRRTELTLEGQIVGTLATMSPEQVRGDLHRIDARSDVYALGAMGYELLSGSPPLRLDGKSLGDAARIVEEVDPPQLSTITPECRGDLDVIIGKALEKDPERRYASASALAADLRRFLRDEPILARPRAPRRCSGSSSGAIARRSSPVLLGFAPSRSARRSPFGKPSTRRSSASSRPPRPRKPISADGRRAARPIARISPPPWRHCRPHDVEEATRRLDEAPADLRGWEWDHLRSRLDESVATFLVGKGVVTAIDVSPDGRYVAAGLESGKLELWSLETGERVATNPRTASRCDAVRFTPDGTQVLSRASRPGPMSRPTTFPNYPSTASGRRKCNGWGRRFSTGRARLCCES